MKKLVGLAACLAAVACGSEFDNDISSTEDQLASPRPTETVPSSVRQAQPRMGTLTVRVSPESGAYQILDVSTGTLVIPERTGSHIFRLPMGSYVVSFKPISGFVAPASDLVVDVSSSRQSDSVAGEYGTAPTDAGFRPVEPNAELDYGIKALGNNRFEISKDDFNTIFDDLGDLFMQARIVPAFRDGEPIGFKLFSIRPGSLHDAIGIRNGDVMRRINGDEINSPDKALEVCKQLRESNRIEIELERNGSQVIHTIYVTP